MQTMTRTIRALALLAIPMAGLLLGGSEAQADGHGSHNNHGGHNNHGNYGGHGHGYNGGFGGFNGYRGGFGYGGGFNHGFGYGGGFGNYQAPFCGRCHHRHFGGCR